MNRTRTRDCAVMLLALAGCSPATAPPVETGPPPVTRDVRRPVATERRADDVEISYDTDGDRRFAEFLQSKSGGMIRKAAVGLAEKGTLRIELDRSVAPEDTLPLTKSILAGARKDFPDRPIRLSVYDPDGGRILTAHYKPGTGVRYQIAHGEADGDRAARPDGPEPAAASAPSPGVTAADRKFARWAEEHGRAYLRYVQADLDRHGRLWFGITSEVKPADVRDLARSLLEGARKEFPDRDLTATVFDPDGERIGRARLGTDGELQWRE